jgi:hypothetical protein
MAAPQKKAPRTAKKKAAPGLGVFAQAGGEVRAVGSKRRGAKAMLRLIRTMTPTERRKFSLKRDQAQRERIGRMMTAEIFDGLMDEFKDQTKKFWTEKP